MCWGKLQGVQEPGRSKPQSPKKQEERLPFSRLAKSVTANLPLLKGTHQNHV